MMKQRTYDERFRRKLNMLEPGGVMLKIIGALAAAALIFYLTGLRTLCGITLAAAGVMLAVLIILLMIESRQDRILNEIAERENKDE